MLIDMPQELIDKFVDYLEGDQDALYSCSLTCRALSLRSCALKFAYARLGPGDSLFPDTAGYIRHLEISRPKEYQKEVIFYSIHKTDPESLPWNEIVRCTRLQRLSLRMLDMESHTSRILGAISEFPELHTLELNTCHFETPNSTAHMIRSCPNVVSVCLKHTYWKQQNPTTSEFKESATPPPLSYLQTSSNFGASLPEIQLLSSRLMRCRLLDIRGRSPIVLSRIIYNHSPTLEQLDFSALLVRDSDCMHLTT